MPRRPVLPAPLLAFAAIVSVQFGAALARTRFDEVGPLGAAFLRLILGGIMLVILLRPNVRGWSRHFWLQVILLGLMLGGMNQLLYLAVERIPLGIAVTVEFLGPLVLALVQVRRISDALWGLLAFVGVALIGVRTLDGLDPLGLAFAATAGLCWAGYIVQSSRVAGSDRGNGPIAIALLIAMVTAAPLGIAQAGTWFLDPSLVLTFLGVALLSAALPYLLELIALRSIPTRVFGVLQSLGPAMSAVAGWAILHQALSALEILALVLVSVASFAVTWSSRPPRTPPLREPA